MRSNEKGYCKTISLKEKKIIDMTTDDRPTSSECLLATMGVLPTVRPHDVVSVSSASTSCDIIITSPTSSGKGTLSASALRISLIMEMGREA